jgi:hypothetical protein
VKEVGAGSWKVATSFPVQMDVTFRRELQLPEGSPSSSLLCFEQSFFTWGNAVTPQYSMRGVKKLNSNALLFLDVCYNHHQPTASTFNLLLELPILCYFTLINVIIE